MNLKKNNNMNVPKKKANKNDVYAIILAILIIFWTIASVFGFIGYARASKNRDTAMITASADTATTENYIIRQGYYKCIEYPSFNTETMIPISYIVSASSLEYYGRLYIGPMLRGLSDGDSLTSFFDGGWNSFYSTGRVIYVTADTPCSFEQYTAFDTVYDFWGHPTDSDVPFTLYFNSTLNTRFFGGSQPYPVMCYSDTLVASAYYYLAFNVADTPYRYVGFSFSAPNDSTPLMVYSSGSWLHESYRTLEIIAWWNKNNLRYFLVYNTTYLGELDEATPDSSGGNDTSSGNGEDDTPQENPIISQGFNNYSISLDELNGLSVGDSSETGFSYELGYNHEIYVVGAQLSYFDYLLTDSEGVVQADIPANFTFRSFSDRGYINCGGYIEIVENDYSVGDYHIPDTGYNVFTDYTCYISNATGVGLDFEYSLTFKWYETLQDTNPIEFNFDFIITISFGNLYTTYNGYSLYMPMKNVVLTDSTPYSSSEYFQSQQSRFDNLALTYTNAYNNGYNKGVLAGSTGGSGGNGNTSAPTFFNLITAVVDAPIQAFTGLFNFDLLGVNLTSFFLALLTVAVFIAVIRLIL